MTDQSEFELGNVTADQILNTETGTLEGTLHALALAVACAIICNADAEADSQSEFYDQNADLIAFGLISAVRSAHFMIESLVNERDEEWMRENIFANSPSPDYSIGASFCLASELTNTDPDDIDYFFQQILEQVSEDQAMRAMVSGLFYLVFFTIRYGVDKGMDRYKAFIEEMASADGVDEMLEVITSNLSEIEMRITQAAQTVFGDEATVAGYLEPEGVPRFITEMDPFEEGQIRILKEPWEEQKKAEELAELDKEITVAEREYKSEKKRIKEKHGGTCFVATAALGSKNHPDLTVLRRFRDERLMSSRLGQIFVSSYYRVGPFLASVVRKSRIARLIVLRIVIKPAVKLAKRHLS